MSTASQTLVLVDGSSYLYRAFHALPSLMTSGRQPTGAIKGVVNMLRRLQKDYPDSPIAVVFDAKGKTFRDDIFKAYKANRPPMPDELREQIAPLHAVVDAMGLPLIVIDNVEADDVIGTLAAEASAAGQPVLISTGDKDMAQLVNEHVTLVNTMTETVMDPPGVLEKFGIPPALIIDFLALMGDKVDNIPGVAGIGEKTALALIQGLGSLDEIYSRLDEVKDLSIRGAKTLADKLRAGEADARLSYELATIKLDVELPFSAAEIVNGEEDRAALLRLFKELEFKSWIDEYSRDQASAGSEASAEIDFDGPKVGGNEQIDAKYDIVLTEKDFDTWVARLEKAELLAFDTETTSLNYMQAEIVGVSFAVSVGEAAYVPVAHDYMGAPAQLDRDKVLARLKPLLEDPSLQKVGQNLKYDRSVLLNYDIELRGIAHDTMLESYVLDSTATRHDMDSLALKYLGRTTIHFEDVAGKGAKQIGFNQVNLDEAGPYAAEDADITLQLHRMLWPKLSAQAGPKKVYEELEVPLLTVLSDIERNGAYVSGDMLKIQSREFGEQLLALEAKAHELAGHPFNLASPKQLGEILFTEQELPVVKKTAKGAPSTAEEVLVELAHDYELPGVILEYRGVAKLKSTYTDKLPEMISPKTGRIHTSYHQAVAATGRLSSADPNLQNIPIKNERGRRIRQAFLAPEGYRIVAADYSQIELRIMAHLSADKGLITAFAEGRDVHSATAAEVFGVALEEVDSTQRRNAKAINFGLIYGMSAFGLARQLRIGRDEAKQYIDLYFERFPGVLSYMDNTRKVAAEQGYVETIFGRRLYLPEINARNGQRRQAAERAAINAPMQGSAADIIKRAMIDVHDWLQGSRADARMIMQVHDELVLEVASDSVDTVTEKVVALMSGAAQLAVPLEVGVGVGDNWDEAH